VLAANGLDSPFCREPAGLPAGARENCAASRFLAGPYPTANYMFDVNIDTGVARWSSDASALVQNLAQLAWMWLVSLTHGLLVMLEWCYSLGHTSHRLTAEVAGRLRATGLGFTQPLLAVALSLTAALAAYRGLIRRRAAETVGQVAATLAMMAMGLWLILDPVGTVGELQQWSDEAGVGTLSIVSSGGPDRPRSALAGGLGQIFGVVVTAPWCYMEFGDVRWCESPRRLDGRLRAAGLRIAARLESKGGCRSPCRPADAALSARLLRRAQTNGEVFLALPAEQPERNSTHADGSLLNVLCGKAESAKACRGSTAAQAAFRTENGTYGRVIGLLLIWMGGLGMLLLFGFLAVRLLLCGVAALGYLLLAPAAALIPVFGEGGRALFRLWAIRLLAAAVSKLTYSFLLGVVLTVTSVLLDLTALGWWAQWLLLSAFWWGAFARRHHTLLLLSGGRLDVVRLRRSLPRRWGRPSPRRRAGLGVR
jgi:hypothetical protein